MEFNLKRLGDYIEQIDIRNKDLSVNTLLGVSIEKKFIPSIANTVGTDFSKYKVLEKGQFAYGTVTSRNGDKVSIALLRDIDKCIISSSYISFRIINEKEVNPEYLMLIFSKPEFDRYARYNSWGSAREIFSWEELCEMKVNIPTAEEQEKIVKQYNNIIERISILNQINDNLEKQLKLIFYELFYKKINDIDTKQCNLYDEFDVIDNRGKTPKLVEKSKYPIIDVKALSSDTRIIDYSYCTRFVEEDVYNSFFRNGHPKKYDSLLSTVGSLAEVKIYLNNVGTIAQNVIALRPKNNYPLFMFQYLISLKEKLVTYNRGSVQPSIKVTDFMYEKISIPKDFNIINQFEMIADKLTNNMLKNSNEIENLKRLASVIL